MPKRTEIHVEKPTFYSLFNQENKLDLPMFQRDYSWEDEELTKFWDEVVKTVAVQGLEQFMGQIVLGKIKPQTIPTNSLLKNFYNIIDGQQRITTATIFLCALRDVAYEDKNDAIAKDIQRYIVTISGSPSQDADFVVTLGYSDKKFFKNFIQFEYNDPRKKKKSDYLRLKSIGEIKLSNELIYDAYTFFIKKIKDTSKSYTLAEKINYIAKLKDRFFLKN